MDESCQHMAILQVEVVMGAIHIGGDDRGKEAAMLLMVSLVHDVNHPLGHAVAIVGVMWRAIVDL